MTGYAQVCWLVRWTITLDFIHFAHIFPLITHSAVTDIFLISCSDCSLYEWVMQKTVRHHYMKGEETTPGENEAEREGELKRKFITSTWCIQIWHVCGTKRKNNFFRLHGVLYMFSPLLLHVHIIPLSTLPCFKSCYLCNRSHAWFKAKFKHLKCFALNKIKNMR